MKNIYKWLITPSFLIIFLTFCNNKQESQDNIRNTLKTEGLLYKLDLKNTEVNWSAYKTNDKIKVSGSFNELYADRENQSFHSIDDLVDSLTFSIRSLSSSSGDALRDLNIKDYFFKYLTDNFEINGTLGKPINDSIDISFNILGENQVVRFAYSTYMTTSPYANQIIQVRGTIDLISQFHAIKAYNSIHERCLDLHKGSDGISKTWKEVDIEVKALVINQNNPNFD